MYFYIYNIREKKFLAHVQRHVVADYHFVLTFNASLYYITESILTIFRALYMCDGIVQLRVLSKLSMMRQSNTSMACKALDRRKLRRGLFQKSCQVKLW